MGERHTLLPCHWLTEREEWMESEGAAVEEAVAPQYGMVEHTPLCQGNRHVPKTEFPPPPLHALLSIRWW